MLPMAKSGPAAVLMMHHGGSAYPDNVDIFAKDLPDLCSRTWRMTIEYSKICNESHVVPADPYPHFRLWVGGGGLVLYM